jgi:hypothetical protein
MGYEAENEGCDDDYQNRRSHRYRGLTERQFQRSTDNGRK